MALSASVRVTPGVQPQASLIDLAWEGMQNHSGTSQGMSSPSTHAAFVILSIVRPQYGPFPFCSSSWGSAACLFCVLV